MKESGRLLRAVGFGVAAAFLLGGAFVLYSGIVGVYGSPDCSNLSPIECSFAHETAANVGRLQMIFGAGMVALAIAVWVLWRTRSKPSETNA